MNAHLDTVFADGTAAARPFAVNGNIATGPGCSDCKAGVVSILYALKAADPKDLDRLAIAVCMDPDEETGSKNSAAWMRSIASRTKQGLVFEAARPNGALVRSRKGAYQLRVHVKGIAAHSGNNPKAGRSAILEAARMINEIAELSDFDGTGVTVNTGMISGGSAINVIAPECTFGVDIRAWTDKDMDEALAKIRDRAAHPSIDGVTISIDLFGITPAMPRSEAGSELVAKINKAAQLAGLSIVQTIDAGYAVAHLEHGAYFLQFGIRADALQLFAQDGGNFTYIYLICHTSLSLIVSHNFYLYADVNFASWGREEIPPLSVQ